jgi:hypothetical protein
MVISWQDFTKAIRVATYVSAAMLGYLWILISLEPSVNWDQALGAATEMAFYWIILPTFLMVCYVGHQYYKTERAKFGQL